ncbi:Cyanovirin-N [Ascobolus immersus RN42]|uniref:Cyanovirin-N n=1 Tax=Ascobolus immersus RN42 TaxID=1160509 RepID=A0A3N4HU58_ASCIM|nr:Cyanovirin-N [Ascobolus immersus RN42]
MKFTAISSLSALLGATTFFLPTVSAGGFAGSCDLSRSRLTGTTTGLTYETYCRKTTGTYVKTTVGLNNCFANANGNLAQRANGGFMNSCIYPELNGGRYFEVRCRNTQGVYIQNSRDLDASLTNYNGVIRCDV